MGSTSWLNSLLMVVADTVLSSMEDKAKAALDAFLSMKELPSQHKGQYRLTILLNSLQFM